MCTFKSRSCHRRCYVRNGVLENFAKFIGKHLSPFLIKLYHSQQLYEKRGFGAGVFLWILQTFLEIIFYRTPLGDNFFRSTWSYVQHTCLMTKIIIYASVIYVSIDYFLFVSSISVNLLILNSRGIKYKVRNSNLL